LVLLVPALGLTERPHYTSDRYDYLPGLIWAMVVALALWKTGLRPGLRRVGVVCTVGLALFWATLSVHQTSVWRDSVTLFTHTLRVLGTNAYGADIHWRLGRVLASQGRSEEAVRHYQTSVQIDPRPNTYADFALLMENNGNLDAALTNYQALLTMYSAPFAFARVGRLMSQLGRDGEAISFCRGTLVAYPDLAPVLNDLGWLLATAREETNRNSFEAVQLAQRACALTGRRDPVFVGTLAAAYADAGRFSEAVETAQEACNLAHAAGRLDLAETQSQLLELYRSRQPYRRPPPHGSDTTGRSR
jgi:tetratricopeptide (TPR) repeat protein